MMFIETIGSASSNSMGAKESGAVKNQKYNEYIKMLVANGYQTLVGMLER